MFRAEGGANQRRPSRRTEEFDFDFEHLPSTAVMIIGPRGERLHETRAAVERTSEIKLNFLAWFWHFYITDKSGIQIHKTLRKCRSCRC